MAKIEYTIDAANVVLKRIAEGVDKDEFCMTDEARLQLANLNAAIARQDKRLGMK